MTEKKSSSLDAKTIAAIAALIAAISGGVEMRVQIGLVQARLDRIEAELRTSNKVAAWER